MLRIPHCLDNRLIDGGKVVSPMHRPLLYSPETLFLCFWYSVVKKVKREGKKLLIKFWPGWKLMCPNMAPNYNMPLKLKCRSCIKQVRAYVLTARPSCKILLFLILCVCVCVYIYIKDLMFSWRCLWRIPSSGMLCHVALVRTEVLEKRSASIRVIRIGELGTLAVWVTFLYTKWRMLSSGCYTMWLL
jgi:hypothetical protein